MSLANPTEPTVGERITRLRGQIADTLPRLDRVDYIAKLLKGGMTASETADVRTALLDGTATTRTALKELTWALDELEANRGSRGDTATAEATEVERLREALSEIAKGEGDFSRDQLTFAGNVIDNAKRLANEALYPPRVVEFPPSDPKKD